MGHIQTQEEWEVQMAETCQVCTTFDSVDIVNV